MRCLGGPSLDCIRSLQVLESTTVKDLHYPKAHSTPVSNLPISQKPPWGQIQEGELGPSSDLKWRIWVWGDFQPWRPVSPVSGSSYNWAVTCWGCLSEILSSSPPPSSSSVLCLLHFPWLPKSRSVAQSWHLRATWCSCPGTLHTEKRAVRVGWTLWFYRFMIEKLVKLGKHQGVWFSFHIAIFLKR